MNLLGIHLTLMIGSAVPTPASPFLVEALRSAEVKQQDDGPSGFQLTFHVGRSSVIDLRDYRILIDPVLKPFSRVVLMVRFAIAPTALMDGIITKFQLSPSSEPGASTLTITGEDVSVMMDLEEKRREHTALPDNVVVERLLAPYIGSFSLIPRVEPGRVNTPPPTRQTPQQTTTDRAHIRKLAERNGHVFYIEPGPVPLSNTAYWGPQNRAEDPQSDLCVNMGPNTNVDSITFSYDALAPTKVTLPSNQTIDSTNIDRLAACTAELRRGVFLTEHDANDAERAQAKVDKSLEEVVTAEGELDVLRYNGLLKPRRIVDVRGAGYSCDGSYYVKSVTSKLSKGQFKQSFHLTREGTGSLR